MRVWSGRAVQSVENEGIPAQPVSWGGLFTSPLNGTGAQRERAPRAPWRHRGLIAGAACSGGQPSCGAWDSVRLELGRPRRRRWDSVRGMPGWPMALPSSGLSPWHGAAQASAERAPVGDRGRRRSCRWIREDGHRDTRRNWRGNPAPNCSFADVDARIRFASRDRPVTGSGQFTYMACFRRADVSEEYRAKVRVGPDGGIYLQVTRVERGTEVSLGPEVRHAVTLKPDEYVGMRAYISGANPTSISRRLGGPELEPIMGDERLRLRAFAAGCRRDRDPSDVSRSATNVPVTFSFDHFVAIPPPRPVRRPRRARWRSPHPGGGDIASCSVASDENTAWLLDGVEGLVMPLGNLAYESGTRRSSTPATSRTGVARTAGHDRLRATTNTARPAPPATSTISGRRWGSVAGLLQLRRGRVAHRGLQFELRRCRRREWLAELAVAPGRAAQGRCLCTLAAMHEPRFSSGEYGSTPRLTSLWVAMYEAGVDVVLSGHDHGYERFLPQDPYGNQDPVFGIPQFVVGTGGRSLTGFAGPPLPGTAIRDGSSFGVLEVALRAGRFDWRFLSTGGPLADAGSGTCHGAPSEQGLTARPTHAIESSSKLGERHSGGRMDAVLVCARL